MKARAGKVNSLPAKIGDMPRKVGTSFVVTQEQMEWLEAQDESMSQVVRNALEEYREDRQ